MVFGRSISKSEQQNHDAQADPVFDVLQLSECNGEENGYKAVQTDARERKSGPLVSFTP